MSSDRSHAWTVLGMSTLAFSICFAAWLMYGVLITYLVENQVVDFNKSQIGWLIGIPILTGAVMRLPVGIATDKYGGRIVFTVVILLSAVPLFLTSYVSTFEGFLIAGLGFGLAGASFAVGVAYVSVWFDKERIGTALGIFGAGNAGAAVTSIFGPVLLKWLTEDGAKPEGWRAMPQIYAAILVATAIAFFLTVKTKLPEASLSKSMGERLAPMKVLRVWRFGLYYFLVFGAFVALAQWMIPYYVNAYSVSVATAGLLASIFSLPSGVIRALGGWMSDRWGARTVMYWVFGFTGVSCLYMCVPQMLVQSPGQGVMATASGTVTEVTDSKIVVGENEYELKPKVDLDRDEIDAGNQVLPKLIATWQEPAVKVGDEVKKKQLLANGVTVLYYQANIGLFTFALFVVGIALGIGKAAVYKHIPVYFPDSVGVTGGIVGVLGGLGGVFCPIIFGYLLRTTGLWASCWLFLTLLTFICFVWMHVVINRMIKAKAPEVAELVDDSN
ncbi:MAG: MFS transporter [Planctomycetaceae bacterium]|nr:MFS transporter [Planctomycetaceae bacterium]